MSALLDWATEHPGQLILAVIILLALGACAGLLSNLRKPPR